MKSSTTAQSRLRNSWCAAGAAFGWPQSRGPRSMVLYQLLQTHIVHIYIYICGSAVLHTLAALCQWSRFHWHPKMVQPRIKDGGVVLDRKIVQIPKVVIDLNHQSQLTKVSVRGGHTETHLRPRSRFPPKSALSQTLRSAHVLMCCYPWKYNRRRHDRWSMWKSWNSHIFI